MQTISQAVRKVLAKRDRGKPTKKSPEEGQCKEMPKTANTKQLATGQRPKDPTTGQCKEAQGCYDHALINLESGTSYGLAPHLNRKKG